MKVNDKATCTGTCHLAAICHPDGPIALVLSNQHSFKREFWCRPCTGEAHLEPTANTPLLPPWGTQHPQAAAGLCSTTSPWFGYVCLLNGSKHFSGLKFNSEVLYVIKP